MGLFRKKPQTEKVLSEKDKKRRSHINQELEGGNFEKAMELTLSYIEENKGKDPFAEASYNDLASTVLVKKFDHARKSDKNLTVLPMSDYTRARRHLNRSLQLYQSMEKTARNQLLVANSYCKIANLAILAERPKEGWHECQESFKIFRKYRYEKGMKQAAETWYTLRIEKLRLEMRDVIEHFDQDREANRERLKVLREKMRKLQKQLK